MRIDLTTSGLEQPENSKAGRARQSGTTSNQASASASASTAESAGVDRTQFSFDRTRVQTLAALALAAPEIRQTKVAGLGQAISNGEYSVDAGKVADAMTAEFSGPSFR
jgi:flagellar biosynthesis anti-sigma factor FlgM